MWEILGVVTDAKGGGTAADEGLGCIQGQDLPFEKLLHLQSTPPPPRNAVSQGSGCGVAAHRAHCSHLWKAEADGPESLSSSPTLPTC